MAAAGATGAAVRRRRGVVGSAEEKRPGDSPRPVPVSILLTSMERHTYEGCTGYLGHPSGNWCTSLEAVDSPETRHECTPKTARCHVGNSRIQWVRPRHKQGGLSEDHRAGRSDGVFEYFAESDCNSAPTPGSRQHENECGDLNNRSHVHTSDSLTFKEQSGTQGSLSTSSTSVTGLEAG